MTQMPRAAKLYVLAVIVVGTAVLLVVSPNWLQHTDLLGVFLFSVAAVGAELSPVAFPDYGIISVAPAFYLAGVLLFPLGVAVWIGSLASLIADVVTRRKFYKAAFNAAQYAICIGGSAAVFHAAKTTTSGIDLLLDAPALVALTVVYYILNVTAVCVAYGLTAKRSPFTVWRIHMRNVAFLYFASAAIGILIATVYLLKPAGIILMILPVMIIHYAMRSYTGLRIETRETLELLADLIDQRDVYTYQHSQRVAQYAQETALRLELGEDQVEQIVQAARIHDLGKIGVDNSVLLKPGRLGEKEWDVIRRHPEAGADAASRLRLYQKGADLVRYHHEHYDGTGYPGGLVGERIPLGARVIAVADAFDAMTSDRPYRQAMSFAQAMAELKRCRGTQFDPAVVDALVSWIEEHQAQASNNQAQQQAAVAGEAAEGEDAPR